MLNIVSWLWGDLYSSDHVVKLYNGFKRHYHKPFLFHCITDKEPFHHLIRFHPIFPDFNDMEVNYRRLALLSRENSDKIGYRILQVDIDMVITGDLTEMLDIPDPFKIWNAPSIGKTGFVHNPSLMLFDRGYLDHVYRAFACDPQSEINASDWIGSDQKIIANHTQGCPTWGKEDGVYSYRDHPEVRSHRLPDGCKIVGFYGRRTYSPEKCKQLKWVQRHWV